MSVLGFSDFRICNDLKLLEILAGQLIRVPGFYASKDYPDKI